MEIVLPYRMRLKQIVSKLRFSEDTLRPYPAFSLLYFFLSTSLPLGMWDFAYTNIHWAGVLAVGLLLIGLLVFPKSHKKWGSMVILGVFVTCLHIWSPWQSYEKILPRPEVYVEIEALVTDDQMLEEDSLSDLTKTKNVELSIRRLRLSQYEDWSQCRGKILLLKPPENLTYGMAVLAKGALVIPWKSEIPGTFDYRNYLRSKGIRHLLNSDELLVIDQNARGWRQMVQRLIQIREALLERIVRHIDSGRNAKILAAMTLGFRQNLSSEDREIYLRSGTIHVLAISGLHVGVLFTLILFVLAVTGVPFTIRYLIAPLLLLIYVVAAGGAPSAVRAWLMLSIWSIGRGLKLSVIPINTVLVAALILLVYRPFYLFQSGFQFSFIVVLCLVGGWDKGRKLVLILNEKQFWTPPFQRPVSITWLNHIGLLFLRAIISMALAWIGTIGLTAYYNNLFIPASLMTNIFVSFWAWVIIVLGVIKTMLSYLPFLLLEIPTTNVLSGCLSVLHLLGEISSTHGGAIVVRRPSIWITFGYYGVVLLMLSHPFDPKRHVQLLLVLCVIILGFVFPPTQLTRTPRINVFVPASSIVPVITIFPVGLRKEPFVINSGTRRFGGVLRSYLQSQGTQTIDKLLVLNNKIDYYGGCPQLFERFFIRTFYVISTTNNARFINTLSPIQWENKVRWRWVTDDSLIVQSQGYQFAQNLAKGKQEYRLFFSCDTRWTVQVDVRIIPLEGSWVKISVHDNNTVAVLRKEWKFLYANKTGNKTF